MLILNKRIKILIFIKGESIHEKLKFQFKASKAKEKA